MPLRNPFSTPTSRTSSRSSSVTSLNSLDQDLLTRDEDEIHDEAPALFEIERNMPTDTGNMPEFYKTFTDKHPLGNLILRLSSTNAELCKKLNIKPKECPDLDEVCTKFVDAIKLERTKTVSKVTKVTNSIEDSILNKELSYHLINAQVQPPRSFASVPVLTTASKLQEALKVFPTKTSMRFTGSPTGVNIVEFLHTMNTGQTIMNLTQKEFMQVLLRCVSGHVYTLVHECLILVTCIIHC